MTPMEEEAAITTLGEKAGVGKEYRRNLQMLVEFVVASGLVQRDGSQLRLAGKPAPAATDTGSRTEASKSEPEPPNRSRVATVFTRTAEGAIHFNVSVKVEMAELATWPPQRINAFFNGIAAVMRAKAGVEQEIPAVEETIAG